MSRFFLSATILLCLGLGLFAHDLNTNEKTDEYFFQRKGLSELISDNQLADSLNGKAYCGYYNSNHYIGSWIIASLENNCYKVYYHRNLDDVMYYSKTFSLQDEKLNALFSFGNDHNSYDRRIDNTYTPFCFYFAIFDAEHNLRFEWNQSTETLKKATEDPAKVFVAICMEILLPEYFPNKDSNK